MTIHEVVSKRVRAGRWSRKLNQKELGALVGVSGPYIAKLENGRALPSYRMAEILEVTFWGYSNGRLSKPLGLYRHIEKKLCMAAVQQAKRARVA